MFRDIINVLNKPFKAKLLYNYGASIIAIMLNPRTICEVYVGIYKECHCVISMLEIPLL